MRCKNCGWKNPTGSTTCEKCRGTLGEDKTSSSTYPISDRMKNTVSENIAFDESTSNATPKNCPKCGYSISSSFTSCPNCSFEFQDDILAKQTRTCKSCGNEILLTARFCPACGNPTSDDEPSRRPIKRVTSGTVMGGPIMGNAAPNIFCTLKPVAWNGEDVNYHPITYTGDSILLNRANTDANNQSITSREQAILTYEDGDWYLENRSELKSTFIRVNGKVKLSNGDIIILGNREFEFKG